jgi:hypothetical protein
MSGFALNEWIALPPVDVFEFITDTNNAPKVVNSVKSMVKLTDGPIQVGTRYRETRLMGNKEHEAELVVTSYQPHQQYSVQNITQGVETTYTYALAPENNGTRVKLICDVKASGIKKIMVPIVVLVLKKEDGDHLRRLKTAIENS